MFVFCKIIGKSINSWNLNAGCKIRNPIFELNGKIRKQVPREYISTIFSTHVNLWAEYTALFVFLAILIPCLWVAYIWEQIIDPHYESDSIAIPDHKLLRFFYSAAKKINTSLLTRTIIFFIVAGLIVTSSVIDVVSLCPRAT